MTERELATLNVAVYADYENVALGARDAGYGDFDIRLVLERVLDKGKVVLKKAYCDWERYRSSKKGMHEAGFELIEIPHVRISGKNSADIRMVVDALDLCYTKPHVGAFVIVSGDSDFSPLVSKLRENDRIVIGLGVKSSTSDLLVASCDEFIFYDDLVRGKKSGGRRGRPRASKPKSSTKTKAPAKAASKSEETGDKQEAIELVLEIIEGLFRDREDAVWGSMVKQTIKRKKPHFAESYYGYRTFNQLLEDAAAQGLLEMSKDERSGGYVIRGFGPKA